MVLIVCVVVGIFLGAIDYGFAELVAKVFLGIVIGLVVAFIIEYLDHTLKSPDDVQLKLSIADVFFIPRINIFMLQRYLKRNTNQEIQSTLKVKQIAKNSTVWCDIFPNIRQNFENIKDYIPNIQGL